MILLGLTGLAVLLLLYGDENSTHLQHPKQEKRTKTNKPKL